MRAKSYHFGQVEMTATVRQDGSMHIAESRQYIFSGDFHHAYRTLRLPDGADIANLTISEGDTRWAERPGESPGSYTVTRAGNDFRVDWYYQASNESRTFVLDYDITGAVAEHADYAELYWKFIGIGFDVPADSAHVSVILPGSIPRRDIRVWSHGAPWGHSSISDSRVDITCDRLPAHTILEGRVLFPASYIASSPRQDDRTVLSAIVSEEGRWAQVANAKSAAARATTSITEAEVQVLIDRWLSAQNARDFDEYAACYAADFRGVKRTTSGRTYRYGASEWLADRRQMMSRARRLEVTAADCRISLGAGNLDATARFTQYYRSDRYSDKGGKIMRFRKDPATGATLIIYEELEWSERL